MQMTRNAYESLPFWYSAFSKDFKVGDRFRKDGAFGAPRVVLIKKSKDPRYPLHVEAHDVKFPERE
jgi:hypothetical protein